jgi:hypothetical protein
MNDSEYAPPRVFNTVTSSGLHHNLDTVEYLIKQEHERRAAGNLPQMGESEAAEFRRQLISRLIIQGDALGAIELRPTTRRMLLNEQR